MKENISEMLRTSQLKVCGSYLRQERNKLVLRDSRVIILEHILPTTEMLVYHLIDAGAEIFAIVAKPYSIDSSVLKRLKENEFRLIENSYAELENTSILQDLLKEAINLSKNDNKKILIVDVVGYFSIPLTQLTPGDENHFAGVVEDTTFGHNRYLSTASKIPIPIISVARSRLKEIEAHFVGRDGVQALDQISRKLGISITGKHAVVIGYGMIGKNVARSLRAHDMRASVYDIRDHRNLKAFMMGFNVNKKAELLRTADIVYAATGWSSYPEPEMRKPALSIDDILDRVKNNAILVSVGSKNNEFDMERLVELAQYSKQLGHDTVRYKLPNDKVINVVKEGTAVNFILPSIPVGILDLVFAEIVLSLIFLLKKTGDFQMGVVNITEEKYLSFISKDWLRFTNVQI